MKAKNCVAIAFGICLAMSLLGGCSTYSTDESTEAASSEGTGSDAQVSIATFNGLKTLTIEGVDYTLPFSGADLTSAGWEAVDSIEMESDGDNSMFWTVAYVACYNEASDLYATFALRNQADYTVTSLDEAEVAGVRVRLGDLGDTSAMGVAGGVEIGHSLDSAIAILGEPVTNNVAKSRNSGTDSDVATASVEWGFADPSSNELEITLSVDMETDAVESIDFILSKY